MPTVEADALREYAQRIFVAARVPAAGATAVAEHLVEANLKGHDSHGVVRIPAYLQAVQTGRIEPEAEPRIEHETSTTAVVDGGWNFGQVVARFTMGVALAKAREHGVGIAVARHCAHVGRVGAYGEQAAAEGMIGIACVNNPGIGGIVAPFGGARARLSTNPMVFAWPTADPEAPFVLDMATSVAAEGKVRVARNKGAELPPNWILDREGRASRDPADLYPDEPGGPRGALLPLGGTEGHKGFGLAMVVEGLAGALSGAGSTRPGSEGRGGNGVFMMAIDPDPLAGGGAFRETFSEVVEWVKEPPYREGVEEVLTAGEPERRSQAERTANGIPLDDATWRQIAEAAASVGVEPPAV